ncbi:TPA: hypothetical protein R1765_001932 [Campylobacter coli]|nr:hypothetical protein [Campylobacter coli]
MFDFLLTILAVVLGNAISICLIGYVFYKYVYIPNKAKLNETIKKLEELKEDLIKSKSKISSAINQVTGLSTKFEDIVKNIENISKSLKALEDKLKL